VATIEAAAPARRDVPRCEASTAPRRRSVDPPSVLALDVRRDDDGEHRNQEGVEIWTILIPCAGGEVSGSSFDANRLFGVIPRSIESGKPGRRAQLHEKMGFGGEQADDRIDQPVDGRA
jgi:hypothetical protein